MDIAVIWLCWHLDAPNWVWFFVVSHQLFKLPELYRAIASIRGRLG